MPTDYDSPVYAESRYEVGTSPTVIYIPKKEVMFKIMRACIGIKRVEDIWINVKNDEDQL